MRTIDCWRKYTDMPPPLNFLSLPHMLYSWARPKAETCWAKMNGREVPQHLRSQSAYDFTHTEHIYKLPKDFMSEFGDERECTGPRAY